jgi:hypothetical protein
VDEVERRTGIDVLPSIADNLEEELERMVARSNQWQ